MNRLSALALVTIALSLATPVVVAQQAERAESLPNEHMVKAVFLYSFGRYVDWPETAFTKPGDPFVIGIAGEDTFGGALDQIAAKKKVQGRQIVIVRFATPDAYRPCHILFLGRSLSREQCSAFIQQTQSKAVFVVGDTPGLAERGAAASFFVEDERVRVEINPTAARDCHLHLDAKLLALAKPASPSPLASRP